MSNPQIYAGFMSSDPAFEIQRTNNFRIDIDLTAFGAEVGQIGLACNTTGLPTSTTDALEAHYGNSLIKLAGKTTFDDITVSVNDFIERDIEQVLLNWRYAVYDPRTGKVGWAKNYKREARITLYAPNGTRERTWVATGVWPTSLGLGDLDYSNSDLRRIDLTLAVDHAFMDRSTFGNGSGDYGTEGQYTASWG